LRGSFIILPSKTLAVATRDGILVPRVIASAGDKAARRFLEFFAATIRNKNTRMAYYRAAARFFAWCDHHKIAEIAEIEPLHVAAYVEALGKDFEKPTVKQHLAAIRMRRNSLCCLSDSFGDLPRNFPLAWAIAMPSRVRRRIRSASNSANVARMLRNILPIGSAGS
jgi:hypothetical protein